MLLPSLPLSSRNNLRLWNLAALYAGMLMTMLAIYHEYEGSFFRLDTAMSHPSETGVFGHRVLFIGVAWLFKLAIPGLTNLRYFKMSQAVATLFTFLVMRAWVRNFAGEEWEWLSHLLLGAMFVPVLSYYNFYDIAVVGFYAACLMLLLRERYVLYIIVYSLGLWNHENLCMVTGVAVVYLWLERKRNLAFGIAAVQVAIFVLYRVAVRLFLHTPMYEEVGGNVPNGIYFNFHALQVFGAKPLFVAFLWIAMPLAAALLAYRYAPRFLKIALLAHFVALSTGTVLLGKLDEARQWNTMFAIIVPMTVIFVQRIVRGSDGASGYAADTDRTRFSAVSAD